MSGAVECSGAETRRLVQIRECRAPNRTPNRCAKQDVAPPATCRAANVRVTMVRLNISSSVHISNDLLRTFALTLRPRPFVAAASLRLYSTLEPWPQWLLYSDE